MHNQIFLREGFAASGESIEMTRKQAKLDQPHPLLEGQNVKDILWYGLTGPDKLNP